METLVLQHVHRELASSDGRAELTGIAQRIADGAGDPHLGAGQLWEWLRRSRPPTA